MDINKYSPFGYNIEPVEFLSDKVSYRTKRANNWKWVEVRADYINNTYPDCFSQAYKEDVEDNYNLISGEKMVHYKKEARQKAALNRAKLEKEGMDMMGTEMRHFDSLSYMVDGLVGDQQKRLFNYTVTDSSLYTRNYIKDQEDRLLTSYFQQTVIEPARAQAIKTWQEQHGISDIFSIPQEQRQQFQDEINQQVEVLTPREIQKFLKYGAKGRYEEQAQALANAFVETVRDNYSGHSYGLKYLADDAYRHSFATDAMIFYQGTRRNDPFIEYVDPLNFNTGGTSDIFIDGNSWFKRTKYMNPWDIWTEYSDGFTNKDKELFFEAMDDYIAGGSEWRKSEEEKFVINIDPRGLAEMSTHEMNTKKGQARYDAFFKRYVGAGYENETVKVVNVVFSSFRKLKKIRRGYEDGSIRYDYHSEEYQFNPINGDLEEKIIWVREYLACDIIHLWDRCIYTRKGPVECQFRDITDPYTVRSPYTGGFFNDLRGHGKRKTRVSRSKEYIDQLNFHLKIIRDREATDVGKVLLMVANAKPEGWSWDKFIHVIRTMHIIPVQAGFGGLSATDVQLIREVEIGGMQEIIQRINMVNYLFSKIAEIMSYNSSMQGVAPASTSVTNNLSNINRAQSQTHSYTQWYDKIMERVIQNGIYLTKKCAKGGNIFLRRQLSDLSIATIDQDVDETDDWKLNVQVVNDQVEIDKLDIARNVIQPFIQASGISMSASLQSIFAKTRGEFESIITEVEMENQAASEQKQKDTVMNTQQLQQLEKDMAEFKANLKYQTEIMPTNEAKKEMAALNSLTIQKGNDVDQDGQNDFVEKANDDRKLKEKQIDNQFQIDQQKLAIEQQRVGVEREKAQNKAPKTTSQ